MSTAFEKDYAESTGTFSPLVYGAIAGTMIGVGATLYLSTSSGKKLRKEIYNTFNDFSERSQDYTEKFVKNGQDSIINYAEQLKGSADKWINKSVSSVTGKNMIYGALGGAFLGALAIIALAPSSEGKKIRKELKSQSIDWIQIIQNFLGNIESTIKETDSEIDQRKHKQGGVEEILEVANIGLRLWNNLKKRG